MTQTFLGVARQGRNRFRDYLIGILLIISSTFIVTIPILLVIMVTASLYGIVAFDKGGINLFLYGNPFRIIMFFGAIHAGMIPGLFLAIQRVHHRDLLTLVTPDLSISWHRIFKGFIVFLTIWLVSFPVWYLINPSRYTVTFNGTEQISYSLFAILFLPIISSVEALLYGYILQGLGLVIRKTPLLLITFSLISCISAKTIDDCIMRSLMAIFMAWIVLKDNRTELLIGILAASTLISTIIISTVGSQFNLPTIIKIPDSNSPLALRLVGFLLSSSLFYYICFGLEKNQITSSPDYRN